MRTRLRSALSDAMKARDRVAIAALRSALSAIDNAEAVDEAVTGAKPDDKAGHPHVAGSVAGLRAAEVERRVLTDDQVAEIVRAEVTGRLASADEYERLGRADHAERLRGEADVLRGHLDDPPPQS